MARSLAAIVTDIVPYLAKLAIVSVWPQPSTTTAEGLRRVSASFSRTLHRLGIEVEVLECSRVPSEGGIVFMWNQESHLEHLVLAAAIPRPFFSLYNNEVARVPFYGAHMRRTGHAHVDRNDETQWRASIESAAARVHAGECVLVSPEGTRSRDGNLLPMKRGAFILAKRAMRPIVCVTVIGSHARMPRGSAIVRGGPIRVVFSQAISSDADDDRLRTRVRDTFIRIKAEYAL